MTGAAKRILLVSSSGGVLLDLLALRPWWSRHAAVWAVPRAADTTESLRGMPVYWIAETSLRHPSRFVPGLLHAWSIIRRTRPNLIVSAGSGAAVPFFILARTLAIPSFWFSTFNIVAQPGVSERICGRLATRVFVQQPSLLTVHRDATLIGELY